MSGRIFGVRFVTKTAINGRIQCSKFPSITLHSTVNGRFIREGFGIMEGPVECFKFIIDIKKVAGNVVKVSLLQVSGLMFYQYRL